MDAFENPTQVDSPPCANHGVRPKLRRPELPSRQLLIENMMGVVRVVDLLELRTNPGLRCARPSQTAPVSVAPWALVSDPLSESTICRTLFWDAWYLPLLTCPTSARLCSGDRAREERQP
jgi:hypothetical protein